MMAEDDPFVCLHEIPAVVVNFARRGAAIVQREDTRGDPFRIETETNGVGTEGGDEEVSRVQRFTPPGGEDEVSPRARHRDGQPEGIFDEFIHARCFQRRVSSRG